jgi:hypothetical protein
VPPPPCICRETQVAWQQRACRHGEASLLLIASGGCDRAAGRWGGGGMRLHLLGAVHVPIGMWHLLAWWCLRLPLHWSTPLGQFQSPALVMFLDPVPPVAVSLVGSIGLGQEAVIGDWCLLHSSSYAVALRVLRHS